jgi:hypothetical protein
VVTKALEEPRKSGAIGHSLDARVQLVPNAALRPLLAAALATWRGKAEGITGGRVRGRIGWAANHCVPSPGAGRTVEMQPPSIVRARMGPRAESRNRNASSGIGPL